MITTTRHLFAGFAIVICGCGSSSSGPAEEEPPTAERVSQVRALFRAVEFREPKLGLIRRGRELFPTYEAILNDPNVSGREIVGVFSVLLSLELDRSRFRRYAVSALSHEEGHVRSTSVNLLAQIGVGADVAFVVPKLSDPGLTVPYAAARTLAAIGGPAEAQAIKGWLDSGAGDAHLRGHVQTQLQLFQARLDGQPKTP